MGTCKDFAKTAQYLVAYSRLYEAVSAVIPTVSEEEGTREELRAGLMLIEAEMQRAADFATDFLISPQSAITARLDKLIDALEFDASYKLGPGAIPALFTSLAGDIQTQVVVYKDSQIVFEIANVDRGGSGLYGALEAWQFSDYALEVEILFDILEVSLTEELREAMDFASHALAIPHVPVAEEKKEPPVGCSGCPGEADCFDLSLSQLQTFAKTVGLQVEVVFGDAHTQGRGEVRIFKNFSWCGENYTDLDILFYFTEREGFITKVAEEFCGSNPFGLVANEVEEEAEGSTEV